MNPRKLIDKQISFSKNYNWKKVQKLSKYLVAFIVSYKYNIDFPFSSFMKEYFSIPCKPKLRQR
jgi:hypothetical protein